MKNYWTMLVKKVSFQRTHKNFLMILLENHLRLSLPELLTPQKPLTSSEKSKKNELQRIINNIAEAYNLPPEVISTSKSLIRFMRGDLSAPLCSGWRAKLFNKEELNAK